MTQPLALHSRIQELAAAGSGWVEMEQQLGVDRHTVFGALRDDLIVRFRHRIIELYEEGMTSRTIYRELDLTRELRCGGAKAEFVVKRLLISVSVADFAEMNSKRRLNRGNVYRFTGLDLSRDNLLAKQRQGYSTAELANLFAVTLAEVEELMAAEA